MTPLPRATRTEGAESRPGRPLQAGNLWAHEAMGQAQPAPLDRPGLPAWCSSRRRLVRIGAGVVLFVAADLAAVTLAGGTSGDRRPADTIEIGTITELGSTEAALIGAPPAPLEAQPRPTKVAIPAIRTSSRLVDLHVTEGELAVPKDYSKAGWWSEGILPGQAGPAVIVGHVDSTRGAAVFYRIRELKPGDTIDVTREDSSVITFKVDTVRQVPKAQFPTREIYGPTPVPTLRLITCGGRFDRAAGHYEDNVVVFATLVPPPPPTPVPTPGQEPPA